MTRGGDRGSATVAACFVMLALLTSALVAVHLGAAVVARHRAQSAADLAALAAAAALERGNDAACVVAGEFAARASAALDSCTVEGWDVTVRVAIPVPVGFGIARAAARAGIADER